MIKTTFIIPREKPRCGAHCLFEVIIIKKTRLFCSFWAENRDDWLLKWFDKPALWLSVSKLEQTLHAFPLTLKLSKLKLQVENVPNGIMSILKKTPYISQKRYYSHIRWYFGWFWWILSQFFSEIVDRHVPEVFTSIAPTTHLHCHSSWKDLTWEENQMNQFSPLRSWLAFLEKAVVCSTVDPCQTLKIHEWWMPGGSRLRVWNVYSHWGHFHLEWPLNHETL